MTTFELIQNLTMYVLAHAVGIAITTESIKRVIVALTDWTIPKPIKVLIPVALGVSSLFVARFAVRFLGLTEVVCDDVEDCVGETLWICGLWWLFASSIAIGVYHLTLLLWVDLIQAAKNKISAWSKS